MREKLIPVLIIFLLSGCATQRIPFPEAEYAGLNLSGDKTVKGKIFLVDQLREEQFGSGSEVTLEPITSYSEQWYEVSYLKNKSIKKPDPNYQKYVMRTTADKNGRYSFPGVAPGKYLLTAPLFWKAIDCAANVQKTKIMISLKINVEEGGSVVIIPLTKEYQSPAVVCDLYTQGAWEKESDW